jgi:hypothetical protein
LIRRPGRPRRSLTLRRAEAVTLSDAHRAWIVENALRGADRVDLVDALVLGGVPRRLASAEVLAILGSPAWPGVTRVFRRAERLELVVRLLREAARIAPRPDEVERRVEVTAGELFDRYLAASRPVVITGMLAGWPALGKWTPSFFAEQFGDVEIEIVADRDADPEPDRHLDRHRRTTTLGAYVQRITTVGASNDLYLVAGNRAFELPELRPLLDDLTPPADIFEVPVKPGDASLWLGPAGTVTPLHHDTTNILICQIHGRKRFDLVSPLCSRLLDGGRGFFAGVRAAELAADESAGSPVLTTVLAPGEALLLPVGWWHEVMALEPSIHVSLLSFLRGSPAEWYCPADF